MKLYFKYLFPETKDNANKALILELIEDMFNKTKEEIKKEIKKYDSDLKGCSFRFTLFYSHKGFDVSGMPIHLKAGKNDLSTSMLNEIQNKFGQKEDSPETKRLKQNN